MNRSIPLLAAGSLLAAAAAWSAPANPNANEETKKLLAYLVGISGNKILSGQESMFSDGSFPSVRDQYVKQKTGKYPAVFATDLGDQRTNLAQTRGQAINNMIAYHKQGSIVALQYHMVQPDVEDGSGFDAMHIKGSTYTRIPEILTEGSALNQEYNKRLDELAGYFHTLESNGVAVMWRPFHEMNGDWFWWSYQDRFKDLWIYTYNYLTNTKKCNNLLCVFSVNWWGEGSTGKASPSFYYPGDAYVDILGCDVYTNYGHSYGKYVHDELLKLGGGKPIAFTENGPIPDVPALRADQPKWVYWLTWWGFENTVSGTQMNSDAAYTRVYGDPSVITQDEVSLPPIPVRPDPSGTDAGRIRVSYRPAGIAVTAPAGFDRLVLHSLQGRALALLPNSPEGSFIPGGRFPAGTYLLRAYAPNGHVDARIIIGSQR